MPDVIDPADRKRAITQLEQYVALSIQGERIDEADLMQRLQKFNAILTPTLPESDLETVARRLAEQLPIDMDLGSVITSDDYEPWLRDRKQAIDWGRWLAYKTMLIKERRPPNVIDKMDELTDEILDLAGDPTKAGSWKRRGLVLGDVQSGKTGTYLALFNKAADAGYRLFILLAGNTEVLRQQTQIRVDEAFIGRDSSMLIPRKGSNVTPRKHIGVGLIRKDLAQASGMTTVLRDFRRSSYEASNIAIQTNAAHPYVFVVKKNKPVLDALIAWLNEQTTASGGTMSVPVLVLDDESDYASINTKSETDPTSINKAIRDVLALFSRSSYVAFTATPFANVFVDHGIENDIFPRSFVYSLDAPTNYVGSVKTFGTSEAVKSSGLTDLVDVEEFIPLGHKSGLEVSGLPASLIDAIDTFLLCNAIRDLRGDVDQPRAMLVNVSRFKAVQRQVFDLLDQAVAATKTAVELHYADAGSQHTVVQRLRRRFEADYVTHGVTWSEVLQQLPKAISDVRVRLFNSDTDRRMQEEDARWDRPARMIAVGGDVLSRGLTLEGLCVSYFYRRVTASDTLMQMGRWFGYRDGYEDLCRIWINAESADNYRFSADSIEELRMDLRLMRRQNLTPEDFGLAVRKHPGALLITARNKMKNAQEVSRTISLAGRRLETTTLLSDHERNRDALTRLVRVIDAGGAYERTRSGWHRWLAIDRATIAEFLKRYSEWAPNSDPIFSGVTLSNWAKASKFASWDVALANGRAGAVPISIGKRDLPLPQRVLRRDGDLLRVSGSSRRLAGPTDLAALLDPSKRKEIEAKFKAQEPGKAISERIYYPYLDRPALIVYPLGSEAKDGRGADDAKHCAVIGKDDHLVALKVAIPGDTTKVRDADGDVTYMINTVAQQYWLSEFSDADDEDVDD
jgi:hypothetical protein